MNLPGPKHPTLTVLGAPVYGENAEPGFEFVDLAWADTPLGLVSFSRIASKPTIAWSWALWCSNRTDEDGAPLIDSTLDRGARYQTLDDAAKEADEMLGEILWRVIKPIVDAAGSKGLTFHRAEYAGSVLHYLEIVRKIRAADDKQAAYALTYVDATFPVMHALERLRRVSEPKR